MSYLGDIKRAECTHRSVAEDALSGLSDKEKVNFALALMMKTTDPDAAACLRFASSQIAELANILMREAFGRECG
jgi:hypothetical protein